MARARDLQTLIDSVKPTAGEMLTVPDLVARRALSVVASCARDAGDCRLLLQALGLMPEDGQAAPFHVAEPVRGNFGAARSATASRSMPPCTSAGTAPARATKNVTPAPDNTCAAPNRRRKCASQTAFEICRVSLLRRSLSSP
ncbi:hypothetical protein [Streptomyces sp. CB03911]|uniref:hypothetical protein n=1 Tax=Streptomyces sp. CB03911 TaxID=1804758 RepID=UPI0018FE7B84|nr:hypothetical protein [Streptomyces sp. CB03911]